MKSNVLEKIDDLFKEGEPITLQKIESFVQETLQFFEYLRTILATGTPEEKQEALKFSKLLQDKLQSFSEKALSSARLAPEQLEAFLSPANFNPQDWKKFEAIQQEITDYQKTMQPAKKIPSPKKREVWKEKI